MKTRKGLMAGIVAGSVALGAVLGAVAFAPGLGIAQTDEGTEETIAGGDGVERWCFGDGEGPIAAAADAIGIPHGDLLYAMYRGSTIAEVAESEGVDVQVVIDAIVASMQERLDAAVANGFLSREVADEIAAGFEDKTTAIVNGEHPFPGFHGRPGFGFGHGPWSGGPWSDPSAGAEADAQPSLD